MLFARLDVRVGILHTCRKHLRDHIISHLIEVPVPSKESERSCICVLWVYNFLLEFGNVLTVFHFMI